MIRLTVAIMLFVFEYCYLECFVMKITPVPNFTKTTMEKNGAHYNSNKKVICEIKLMLGVK
jgi:hypothetical protein